MKIAVTGATGFIGKHVINALSNLSVEVIALSRKPITARFSKNVICKELDLRHPPNHPFSYMEKPDVLIHLAWGGLPNYRSTHHFSTELPAQYNFLSTSIDDGVDSIFCAGTCFEYGMQSGKLAEKTLTQPGNPYGFAKDCLLKMLQYLQIEKKFSLIWGRIFYLYGDGQDKTSLWPQFQDVRSSDLNSFNMSGGQQVRDFLPVEKAASIITRLALSKLDAQVVNICSGKPQKIESLVRKWARDQDWKGDLNLGYYPYPDYEPMEFWGDSGKLEKLLEKI